MRPLSAPLRLALDEPWQPVLDAVLARLGAPATRDVARLGPKLADLSRAYNTGDAENASLEARVAFSFARDVPKGAAAVRELVAARVLRMPADRPLRVLDVGAGLGAMTWGIARALAAAGEKGRIEALLVDADARALEAAARIAAEVAARPAAGPPGVEVAIETRALRLGGSRPALPVADLVVAGQVLSELDTDRDPGERVERHVTLLSDLLKGSVAPDGALVVVEPALRDRTRHLHAVRDRLVASGATVFAPCLHARACPALASETDWCHEDLRVDLPPWLVPLARAAGLRWQGLTFSYLVLTASGDRLVTRMAPGPMRLRVVSDLLRTKGKTELFGCTETGERMRLRRLDRDEKASPAAPARWDALERGDLLTLQASDGAPADEKGRLAPNLTVDVWPSRR